MLDLFGFVYSRIATSVGGTLLAVGGNVIVIDDPHNVADVESEAERQRTLNSWSKISTTRLNDSKQAAIVVIMQRLHEEDVSGQISSSENLCIPMMYDPSKQARHGHLQPNLDRPARCVTVPLFVRGHHPR
jgi:hypothetical protein